MLFLRAVFSRYQGGQLPARGGSPPVDPDIGSPEEEPKIILQPQTRPISHEQLVIEVKGIYARLVMVEAKCIEIDERQSAAAQEMDPSKKGQLKNEEWQSLLKIHIQLLYEHFDFFMASQHPSASPALGRLATKLPESLEHMLAFIYIAHAMIALLYETVSAFEDTWIECLGDLGRYRMAIEDDNPRDRDTWSEASRRWYNISADKCPTIGRLYHHLAILARPYSLEQLSLYMRSLTSITPFESARASIMTLFNPILQGKDKGRRQPPPFEIVFIRLHGILFTGEPPKSRAPFDQGLKELDGVVDDYMSKGPSRKARSRLAETGVHAAVSNIAALFEYSTPKQDNSKSRLRLAYEHAQTIKDKLPSSKGLPDSKVDEASAAFISKPSRLAFATLAMFLKRTPDKSVYPLLHVYLTFIWSLVIVQQSWNPFVNETVYKIIEEDIPWDAICSFLNTLLVEPEAMAAKVRAEGFPEPDEETGRLLAEDIIRGQIWALGYFPNTWFTETVIDHDEDTVTADGNGDTPLKALRSNPGINSKEKTLLTEVLTHTRAKEGGTELSGPMGNTIDDSNQEDTDAASETISWDDKM